VRQHPFGMARLQDKDMALNFAELASPEDRVAVIATEPLTLNEQWTAMVPGQLLAVEGGRPV
jgi:predicted glutamine amidotransferase